MKRVGCRFGAAIGPRTHGVGPSRRQRRRPSMLANRAVPPFVGITVPEIKPGSIRDREDHIYWVLAHNRRQDAACRRDDIAYGDRSAADLAVDRCVDLGVAEVDLGRLQLRLGAGDLRCQSALGRECGIDVRLRAGGAPQEVLGAIEDYLGVAMLSL
jgi:hypothetical protein